MNSRVRPMNIYNIFPEFMIHTEMKLRATTLILMQVPHEQITLNANSYPIRYPPRGASIRTEKWKSYS